MWGIETFLVGAWLTITSMGDMTIHCVPPDSAIWTDTTSVVLVEFSENMSVDGLRDVNRYKLIDKNNKPHKIYKIGIVSYLDSIVISDTSLVALITEKLKSKYEYTVIVDSVKDKSGNWISDRNTGWFYFNGFVPNKIPPPNPIFKQ